MHLLSNKHLIDCLNTDYGIVASKLTLLPLGADMDAAVYKAETLDDRSYFVKLKKGHHPEISVKLLALLEASGIQEIIPPIKTIDGKLIQHIEGFTLIVYPFVDGQNGFSHHLTDNQWITLGKALKQVHELDVPPSIKDQIRKETYTSKWREAVRSFDANIDGDVVDDATALKLQAFMKEHRAAIQRLVNRAEALCRMIQEQSPEVVLCHSDIHAGNVLIDGGAIYIVDWDEPIMAPKECDLMFMGGGVANIWNTAREEELFYKGYGSTSINGVILAYYRHERIVKDIVEYVQALLLTSSGAEEERLEMYKQFTDMFEPNGVVDIAFKTDEALAIKDKADEIHLEKCVQDSEWDFAKKLRNKYFFDPLGIKDPYTWTFDHPEHVHFILYQGKVMAGYAHVQLWPDHRAALRIIVVDEPYRNRGLGSQFLHLCEHWLKSQGIKSIHDEARPDAVKFYRKNGYNEMPFNDPSGEPPSIHDLAMGKYLSRP